MGSIVDLSPKTILLIEDDRLSQAFARSALEDDGYRVVVASNGEQGIAAFQEATPDCVLLDMRMPGLDGRETCRRLRALPQGADVPIVFMTAQGSVDSFDGAFACGADDFVTKPVSPSELCDRVRTAIGLRSRHHLATHHDLLKGQRDRLVRQELLRQRLTALLVHDLKAPLNTISLLAELLLRGSALPAAERDNVSEIRAQTQRLAGMVMDLLDISKAKEGHLVLRYEPIDVSVLCANVLSDFGSVAQSRGVALQACVVAKAIEADTNLLRRVLTNLIDNALKHAPSGSTVTLSASPHSSGTQFCVIDAGAGIPPELREKVFDAFAQADDHSELGRGLGLSYCRLAVNAHGGSIWAEDAKPGAAVCFSLPRAKDATPDGAEAHLALAKTNPAGLTPQVAACASTARY